MPLKFLRRFIHTKLFIGLISAFFIFLLSFPPHITYSYADDTKLKEMEKTAYELQQEIESKQSEYSSAIQRVKEVDKEIEDQSNKIVELEQDLEDQKERSAHATRSYYKIQSNSSDIIGFLLNSGTFQDFLSHVEYITRIVGSSLDEINNIYVIKDEINNSVAELRETQDQANSYAQEAEDALDAAKAAQAEVQRRIDEEVRLQAEIAAMAAALAEQERKNNEAAALEQQSQGSAGQSSGSPASSGGNSSLRPIDASSEEGAFVAEWSARINAYLAGSPLAGQGNAFARAAYQYGVDPRLSPAISFTESSKGLYCFRPHNAWGWGSSSWGSWEEAIFDHVAGLARGYGGKLTEDGARKYCPPSWQSWYNRTLSQMNMI